MTLAIPSFPGPEFFASSAWPYFAGAVSGGLLSGALSLLGVWWMSKRLHRMRVLDHARRELKGPVGDYIEWLHALGAEFPAWRKGLIPSFQPGNNRDEYEINRMRKLFVDARSSAWFGKLEEYDFLLGKFSPVINAMWARQAEIGERFHRVLSRIGQWPQLSIEAAEQLEGFAFEQAQLASVFIGQVQSECLKSVVGGKRRRSAKSAPGFQDISGSGRHKSGVPNSLAPAALR